MTDNRWQPNAPRPLPPRRVPPGRRFGDGAQLPPRHPAGRALPPRTPHFPPTPPPYRRPPRHDIPADDSPTEFIPIDDDADANSVLDDHFPDDDQLGEDDDDTGADAPEDDDSDKPRSKSSSRPRRRNRGWLVVAAVFVLLVGGAWYGIDAIFGYDDFEGNGESDVLIQVSQGDSTNAIAGKLTQAGVVASPKAFVKASKDNPRVREIQPGYYLLKTKMSGASASTKMVDSATRVGEFQLRAGTQLDDLVQPDGKMTDGVFTQLMKASCADMNGVSTCVPVEELRKVAETGDLSAMGLPDWAVTSVSTVDPKRRIEGLIQPGVYDVKPGWTAEELLGSVLKTSAARLQSAGLPAASGHQGVTPYQTLIIASLIEREAVEQDFTKVSAVIYNRLAKNMKLEFDSTVNYVLDRPEVRTKSEDRAKAGAYNTYQNVGLPPTPISSPSKEAIAAAEKPASGPWIFFVKCEKNGLSCFAETNADHEQNIREAQARGAY